jgi:2-(3-amino-3-carboxypropyl)histidine synthase
VQNDCYFGPHLNGLLNLTLKPNTQQVVMIKREPLKRFKKFAIPESITSNHLLQKVVGQLPSNYNFEIYKCIWQIELKKAKVVALQFPEGLLMFSTMIADILQEFAKVKVVIMGDVTYGACCIDDYTAKALGADFLIHYGHSWYVQVANLSLIPINTTMIQTMYVFVDISIDCDHAIESISSNFHKDDSISLVSTIQFSKSLQVLVTELRAMGFENVSLPQERPLSPGEILGCTSPRLSKDVSKILYVGDGRFHIESIMISNPTVDAFCYDPYSKILTSHEYDHEVMQAQRFEAISKSISAQRFGLILGTLGRQGNLTVFEFFISRLKELGKSVTLVLLSEISPAKLSRFTDIDVWIQIACPRLSIDWGYSFPQPLLSPYEACIVLKSATKWENGNYPMDFYSKKSIVHNTATDYLSKNAS